MGAIIGIDVGGSTTKIVAISTENQKLIKPMFVRAKDPLTSLYGAFGKFLDVNGLDLSDIDCVRLTGVGASYITKELYGLRTEKVNEFISVGRGGLYLSEKKEALVVSMGTGTALVHAKADGSVSYLGGTGVGGGTLVGLSKLLLKADSVEYVDELSECGDLSKIDLRISDISKGIDEIKNDMTASNFGGVSDDPKREDTALGIVNMIFETIAMMAIFAARGIGTQDIILTGNLTRLKGCKKKFDELSKIFDVSFIIPDMAEFATVIGAALTNNKD